MAHFVIICLLIVSTTASGNSYRPRKKRQSGAFDCPNKLFLKTGSNQTKKICSFYGYGVKTWQQARLDCASFSGHLMYLRDSEEIATMNQVETNRKASSSAKNEPPETWLGIRTYRGNLVWENTMQKVGSQHFFNFDPHPTPDMLKQSLCAISSSAYDVPWRLTWCGYSYRYHCRGKLEGEPRFPTISYNYSYPGAELRDLIVGEELNITCSARQGWGNTSFYLAHADGSKAFPGWAAPRVEMNITTSGFSTATLRLHMIVSTEHNGTTIYCTSDSRPHIITAHACSQTDYYCARLGTMVVSPAFNDTPMTAATPYGRPERDNRGSKWFTISSLVSFLVGFVVSMFLFHYSVSLYLDVLRELPAAAESFHPIPDDKSPEPRESVAVELASVAWSEGTDTAQRSAITERSIQTLKSAGGASGSSVKKK